MKIKYFIVPFSHDGFLPWAYDGVKFEYDTEEEAIAVVEKLLADPRPNQHQEFIIIKGYTRIR